MAARAEPLHVIEDGDTGDRFLVYMGKDGVQVDLRVKGRVVLGYSGPDGRHVCGYQTGYQQAPEEHI